MLSVSYYYLKKKCVSKMSGVMTFLVIGLQSSLDSRPMSKWLLLLQFSDYGRQQSIFQFEVELKENHQYSFWFKDKGEVHLIMSENNIYAKKLPLKRYGRTYFVRIPITRNKNPEKKEFIIIKYADEVVCEISLWKFRRKLFKIDGRLVLPNYILMHLHQK